MLLALEQQKQAPPAPPLSPLLSTDIVASAMDRAVPPVPVNVTYKGCAKRHAMRRLSLLFCAKQGYNGTATLGSWGGGRVLVGFVGKDVCV